MWNSGSLPSLSAHLATRGPLVAVAAELIDRIGQRFGHARAFAFHHHQRDAIHQQHQVGHDEHLAARITRRAVHPVLIDHGEGVSLGVRPVDEVDGLTPATVPAGQAFDRHAAQQQPGRHLIGFHQSVRGDAGDGGHHLGEPFIVEPGLAHRIEVQRAHLPAQRGLLNDIGEAGPAGGRGVVEMALHMLPTHAHQLQGKRLLHLVQFPPHKPPPLVLGD